MSANVRAAVDQQRPSRQPRRAERRWATGLVRLEWGILSGGLRVGVGAVLVGLPAAPASAAGVSWVAYAPGAARAALPSSALPPASLRLFDPSVHFGGRGANSTTTAGHDGCGRKGGTPHPEVLRCR